MAKKSRSRSLRNRPRTTPSVNADQARTPRDWILWLVLGVTFLAFSNTLWNGFAYDDTTQILDNKFIRDLGNLPKALVTETWYWRVQQDQDPNTQDKPSTPYYRPAFVIYLMTMWALFGNWAPGWHLANVALHVLAAYFVYKVLRRFTADARVSAIGAFVFAAHPLRSESVAWISGVTDPLLAVFLLPSLFLYMRYREEKKTKLLVFSLLLFLLATLVKEPAVALSLFIGSYELFVVNQEKRLGDRLKSGIVFGSCFLAVAILYFAARYYSLGFALNNAEFRTYPTRWIVQTIPLVIWKYIGLLVWPVELSLFHLTPMVRTALNVRFIVPLVGLIGLAVALRPLWKSTVARFGILWFAINLLPVLNLGAFDENFLVQERYLYIPSIGFSLLVAMAIAKVPFEQWLPFASRVRAQAAVTTVLVLLFAGKALAQNATWKDDMSVWYHGVKTAPEQPMSHFVLGHKLIDLTDYPKAAEQLELYLKINPDNPLVLANLASCYVLIYSQQLATGSVPDRDILDRALEVCDTGLKLQDSSPVLWDALGTIHTFDTGLKNYDRAIACYDRAMRLSPQNPMLKFHMGGVLVKKGKYDEGISFLNAALAESSVIVDAHKFLAYAYKAKGQLKEAIDQLSIYLQLQPDAPDASKVSKDVQDLRARLQMPSPQS
ncbi:MAG TPA: tetratricopeptide repeat protein [Blastocatellia bacterium]|nr:tetratricopeptide repeat protein [Blastocatellia bacterium]